MLLRNLFRNWEAPENSKTPSFTEEEFAALKNGRLGKIVANDAFVDIIKPLLSDDVELQQKRICEHKRWHLVADPVALGLYA